MLCIFIELLHKVLQQKLLIETVKATCFNIVIFNIGVVWVITQK
jgi:hypothetical protein